MMFQYDVRKYFVTQFMLSLECLWLIYVKPHIEYFLKNYLNTSPYLLTTCCSAICKIFWSYLVNMWEPMWLSAKNTFHILHQKISEFNSKYFLCISSENLLTSYGITFSYFSNTSLHNIIPRTQCLELE